MKGKLWQTLGLGRRGFYLAAIILPLAGIAMHLAIGGFSLFYLIPFTVAFLLGLWNLLLAAYGRLPRKGIGFWDVLLAVTLLVVMYLMWFEIGLIVWLYSSH